jgi:hypothetical protein
MATKNLKKAKEGTTVRNTLSGGTRTKTVSGDTVNITKTDKAGNVIKNKTRNRMQGWEGSEAGGNSGMAKRGAIVKAQYGGNRGAYEPNTGMNRPTTPMGQAKKGAIVKKKMAKGGASSFGMLSVKAGIDKDPTPTAADRIAGATKRKRAKKK